MDFLKAHPLVFVAALLGQLLLVVLLAVLYIRKGRNFKILEVVTLIIAPAISAFAFVFVTFATIANQSVADTRSKAASETAPVTSVAALSGKTPQAIISDLTVVATPSGQTIPVASGSAKPYPILTFSWKPVPPPSPQVTVTGYYVYFGLKDPEKLLVNPSLEGVFTKEPAFVSDRLTRGSTYYLVISVRLTSGNSVFYQNTSLANKGKQIFTYTYQ